MSDNLKFEDQQATATILSQSVQQRIVSVRQQRIIIDADVADLYGVETKRINEAVRNNTDKFPEDYMFVLTQEEADSFAVEKFDRKTIR